MTTASAPGGSMPPVEIRTACPAFRGVEGASPMVTSPETSTKAGRLSEAPYVS